MKLKGSITNLGTLPGRNRGEAAWLPLEKGSLEEGRRVRVCTTRDAEFGEKAAEGSEGLGITIQAGTERVGEEGGSARVTWVQAGKERRKGDAGNGRQRKK